MANKESKKAYFVLTKLEKMNFASGVGLALNLEDAKNFNNKKIKKQKKKPSLQNENEAKKSAFAKLSNEILHTLRAFRALDDWATVLSVLRIEMQLAAKIKPQLEKCAQKISDDSERAVYEFDRIYLPTFAKLLKQTHDASRAVSHFPRLMLIGLVSEYDVFLQKLIRTALSVEKGPIQSIERALTPKELESFGTIQEAIDHLVEREIESILFDDHLDQLKKINRLLNIKIDLNDPCVKKFLEICERRNLYTHSAGIINTRYLKKCSQLGLAVPDKKIGERIGVDRTYYKEAVQTMNEVCLKLCQFIWRKTISAEQDAADLQLNEAAFELIQQEEYSLAERLLDYGIYHTDRGQEYVYRMMVINFANAIKLGGDKKRAISELKKVDWSATSKVFQICEAAVKDDVEAVTKLMPGAAKGEDFGPDKYREWPVFSAIRDIEKFQHTFKVVYSEDFILPTKIAIAPEQDGKVSLQDTA